MVMCVCVWGGCVCGGGGGGGGHGASTNMCGKLVSGHADLVLCIYVCEGALIPHKQVAHTSVCFYLTSHGVH